MQTFISHSPAETEAFARELGARLRPGTCVAFFGGLGAGKTTFTRGLAAGLGLPDIVSSPTFALVNEYRMPGCVPVFHFDMYRVETPEGLESCGFYDYPLEDGIFVIEWAKHIADALPEPCVRISISGSGDGERRISVEGEEHLADACS